MQQTIKTIAIKTAPPILVILAVLFLYWTTDIFKNEAPVVVEPTPVVVTPSQFPDYDAYKIMVNKVTLVEGKESYSPKDKPIIGRVKKTLIVKGEFSRAYLYVRVSVNGGKPLTQWDSIYSTLGYVGGHLYRPNTLAVPNSSSTQLLYGLNQIPFVDYPYSDNKTPLVKDWFSLLKDERRVEFDMFMSSLRAGGMLDLVEIRYECEVNTECSIEELAQ